MEINEASLTYDGCSRGDGNIRCLFLQLRGNARLYYLSNTLSAEHNF
jgi:hypothetical protein